jgi:hypothetical protein
MKRTYAIDRASVVFGLEWRFAASPALFEASVVA